MQRLVLPDVVEIFEALRNYLVVFLNTLLLQIWLLNHAGFLQILPCVQHLGIVNFLLKIILRILAVIAVVSVL